MSRAGAWARGSNCRNLRYATLQGGGGGTASLTAAGAAKSLRQICQLLVGVRSRDLHGHKSVGQLLLIDQNLTFHGTDLGINVGGLFRQVALVRHQRATGANRVGQKCIHLNCQTSGRITEQIL